MVSREEKMGRDSLDDKKKNFNKKLFKDHFTKGIRS